jgi:hypothetical protein
MEYKELSKWVFAMERVDWELHSFKSRKRELVQARQISIYLANWFWPRMTDKELTELFSQSHSLAHSALKHVKALLFSEPSFRKTIDCYLFILDEKMKNETPVEIKIKDIPVFTKEFQEYINQLNS